MNNLVVDNEKYDRIFLYDDNKFLKYSIVDVDAWINLKNKDIDFVNNPTKVSNLTSSEKRKYPLYNSKILLPILKGYKTFYMEDYTSCFSTIDILKLLSKNLSLLEIMHKNNVFHNDISPRNMMLNNTFDIKFIDLDSFMIEDYISKENIYFDEFYADPISAKINNIRDDKLYLLEMYLFYLDNGSFRYNMINYWNLNFNLLPNEIRKELYSYYNNDREIALNYYFQDMISDLIKIGYEVPKILQRKQNN